VLHRADLDDAGVVDQHVEPAEVIDDPLRVPPRPGPRSVFANCSCYHPFPMPPQFPFDEEGPAPTPTGTAVVRRASDEARERSLSAALERFASGRGLERSDAPDGWVTAVRTIAAREAAWAPWPEAVDPRLRDALAARGIAQPYTHQAAVHRARARRAATSSSPRRPPRARRSATTRRC
jgi:hypothetical protein